MTTDQAKQYATTETGDYIDADGNVVDEDGEILKAAEPKRYSGQLTTKLDRGFGFITSNEVTKNSVPQSIFVHSTDAKAWDDLKPGDNVRFELKSTPKGLRAIKVSR